ncbi:hypothetical protein NQ318_006659 [Aromia moschata]|uniref:Uncharacterized protein n=1 Tax=Aromia moschata TaxID=1265417 RepID=A0AAV8YSJ0_9CUCU|nr:hypothetical protein NQ318_006659 [Aromia moschata]
MWKVPDPDPGGPTQQGAPSEQSSQELSDLKDQNEQQKLMIAQLKEMLRKEQSNVTQEKVEEYVNTLSKSKGKKSRLKRDESGSAERTASSSSIDNIKKGKLNLLRSSWKKTSKAKLAERGKNQRGIEEMVIQLKAQLNDSQQLISLAPVTLSDRKNLEYNRNSSPEELYNILLTKEKQITELANKTQRQEAMILDLQENVKEKDSVIDARTKAITLMTENLSKKGKNTLDELDDTKEQMRKMQENFVTLETEMKARQVKLLNDLKAKNLEITELQENNSKLLEEKTEYMRIIEENKALIVTGEDNTIEELREQLNALRTENEKKLGANIRAK